MSKWAITFAAVAIAAGMSSQAKADAASQRAHYNALQSTLKGSAHRGLHIDSVESKDALKGDVYAVLDHPFAMVSASMKEPAQWCEILILPFNTKYCHAIQAQGVPALLMRIGRKVDQPMREAFRIQFSFRNVAHSADYFEARLSADAGPVGTRNYRIVVSAIPLEGGKTFMHLSYAYSYGVAGRMAMQAYLGTVGADKIGFTVTGHSANGLPQYIGGVRGAVERNAMRYYLAIDAYLDSLSAPREQQLERRINGWFSASERYPRQLREMDRNTYVTMKRQEHERQATLVQ